MKLNSASLAIGIGIGIVVAIAATVVFVMQPGRVILNNETAMTAIASNNGSHFFMSGLIKEISEDEMIIDQTFGNPQYRDNPNVKIKKEHSWVFVECRGTGTPNETCEDSVRSRLDEGVHVCILVRMYDGEFYAGKMWTDSTCGPFGIEENRTG